MDLPQHDTEPTRCPACATEVEDAPAPSATYRFVTALAHCPNPACGHEWSVMGLWPD